MAQTEGGAPLDLAGLRRAGDRDRLLPGERPQTAYSDDADHWVRVYTDLIRFNREIMRSIAQRYSPGPPLNAAKPAPDMVLLRAHVRRLRWRLRFWQERLAVLNGSSKEATGLPVSQ